MKRLITAFLGVIFLFGALWILAVPASAQEPRATPSAQIVQPTDRYFRGTVLEIIEEGETHIAGYSNFSQQVSVQLDNGGEKGKKVLVEYGGVFNVTSQQKLGPGDKVVVIKSTDIANKSTYFIMDRYRLPAVTYIIVGFFLLVFLVGGKKGFGAILGLGISIVVILKFIVPQILAGHDPLLVSIAGALMIMVLTIFLAHGFSKKTAVALGATFVSLVITGVLAVIFVAITRLSGLGSENSYLLQFGPEGFNLQGLLLGGIIIGTLGVLDDITTAQSAAVFELSKANPLLSSVELLKRGMNIGREHVASLVNTLVLAYAGAALSLFILFVLNPTKQPYWVILNSEIIVEEVVRTLAGSIGLTLAVPITTLLACLVAVRMHTQKTGVPTGRKFKTKKR